MNKLLVVFALAAFTQCSIDGAIREISQEEMETLNQYQLLGKKSKLTMAEKNEPGEKLLLCVTFVNKQNNSVRSNQLVKFYHTDSNGNYKQSDPNDESTARLSGSVITDDHGRVYVETILPGDYGSTDDNRHIHMNVSGAKPEAYDINFKQYISYLGKRFTDGSDQHFLADLKISADSSLVCFLTIEVRGSIKK
jgi:protocatechuate 3,4-dioxygenase beta subunit